jgi:hypothetical protein
MVVTTTVQMVEMVRTIRVETVLTKLRTEIMAATVRTIAVANADVNLFFF